MPVDAQVGTVIIRQDFLLPVGMDLVSESYSEKWKSLALDAPGIERAIQLSGWRLFFMAGEISAIAFGSGSPRNVRKAVLRIASKVQHTHFNAIEVTEISKRHFVGIPYIRIAAHSRHLQDGCVLESAAQRKQARRDADWAQN
jgi:hypothetical protein